MSTIPPLDQEAIERFVGRRNARRGWDYFRNEAILDPCRQGSRLQAKCIGSGRTPYEVQAVLGEQGVVQARCTCPVGDGGECKHVATLLIFWQQRPEAFVEAEPTDRALSRCSRRQLVAMVDELLRHRPELRHVVESLVDEKEVTPPADLDAVVRQVGPLVAQAENTPESLSRLLEGLAKIVQTADNLLAHHDSESAAPIYEAILEGLLQNVEYLDSGNPELLDLVYRCTQSLSTCLGHLPDAGPARQEALRALVKVYRADVVLGILDHGVEVSRILSRLADAAERQLVSDWILAMLPTVESPVARKTLGGLLLELAGEELTDAQRSDLCRQTGRIFDLVRRLAQAGRFDDIGEESRRADDAELLKIADLLARYDRGGLARRMVEDRAARSGEPNLRAWLQRDEQRQADRKTALECSEKLFRLQPTWAGYQQVRCLARQLGRWDELHGELLSYLRQSARRRLLIRIQVEENDIDGALEVAHAALAAEQLSLAVAVAKVAERSRPLEALELYRQVVEALIARRGRENYAAACRHLRKVRSLMKRTGDSGRWNRYLERLRSDHRALRSLNDELDAAGLSE